MKTRRLMAALLMIALFAMAVRETLDPDMWWHLRTGEVIWSQGLPRYDLFSYTVPGTPWVTHEWLSEAIMWQVYQWTGFDGLMILFAALAVLAFGLVYLRCDGRPYLAAFVVLLGALTSVLFVGVRPQVFNMVMTAVFVFLVEGYKDGKGTKYTLLLLPALTLVWANLHSGYLLGIVLLVVYCLGEAAQLRLGRRDRRGLGWPQIKWLSLMTITSVFAALVNPNGFRLWVYPLETLGSPAMQQNIREWQSPDFHSPYFWFFGLMIALGVLAWIMGRERPALTDVLLFGGTAAAGLISARHIPLFSIVAAPIIARYLLRATKGTKAYDFFTKPGTAKKTPRLALVVNMLILGLGLLLALLWTWQRVTNNPKAIASNYPQEALAFLEQLGLSQERGFNNYIWGGYLIWNGFPVFVDGRADVYGDDFLFTYLQTAEVQDGWQEPLDDFDVRYVLMEQGSSLSNLLAVSDEWQETYSDEVARVFVRDGASSEEPSAR
jgi:hypothetical protein